MNTISETGSNMNNHMSGDYPKLKPGENTISVICGSSSTFSKMTIEYRGRWL